MAVFDAGQGCEKPFFEATLAALQPPAVAVAAAPPAYMALQPAADIFDLVSAAVGICDALQGLGLSVQLSMRLSYCGVSTAVCYQDPVVMC